MERQEARSESSSLPLKTLAKRNIAFKPLPIVDAIGLINAAGEGAEVVADD